jgi:hypothetical protein
MAPEVLHRVCYGLSNIRLDPVKAKLAASLSINHAILHEYCRHQVAMADYPGIVPEKGHTVRGTYVTGLTDGDIYRLDTFEGSEYRRSKVTVALLIPDSQNNLVEKDEVQTETYVFTAGTDRLKKEEWDYDVFRKEKMHRWYDRSEEYAGKVSFFGFCGHILTWSRGRRSGRQRS